MTWENDKVFGDEDEEESPWNPPFDLGFQTTIPSGSEQPARGFARFIEQSRSIKKFRPPSLPTTYPTARELAARPMFPVGGGASSDWGNLADLEDHLIFKRDKSDPKVPDDIRTSNRIIYRKTKPGFIYLVGHEEDALFKIGHAADPSGRARKLHRPLIHTIRTHNMYWVEQRISWLYGWRSALNLGPRYREFPELYVLSTQEIEEFKWFQDYDADRANFMWRIVERRRKLGYNL
jgi:hypothetical protein